MVSFFPFIAWGAVIVIGLVVYLAWPRGLRSPACPGWAPPGISLPAIPTRRNSLYGHTSIVAEEES